MRFLGRFISRLPDRIFGMRVAAKAVATSAVLVICLVAIIAFAFFSLRGTTTRLRDAVESSLEKQRVVEALVDGIADSHLKLFRYVAWASNGVEASLLEDLSNEFEARDARVRARLTWLTETADLSVFERYRAVELADAWEAYVSAANEAMQVSRVDPAMGTMMLGGSDDRFSSAWEDLHSLAKLARGGAESALGDLRTDADSDLWAIRMAGVVAILLSLGAILLFARSIVIPIRSVTSAMRRVSFGDFQFDLDEAYLERRDEIGQMVAAIAKFCRLARLDKDEIEQSKEELRTQNSRFDAALANMSQGLCVFDEDRKLVICNRRYAEMYSLPDSLVRPGTPFRSILEQCVRNRTHVGSDADRFLKEREAFADSDEPFVHAVQLANGRVISLSHQPMPNGGWLSTHEDITDRRRSEEKILFMATHDELTELPNRRLFQSQLSVALESAGKGAHFVAVHCLDLDRFKSVNDTLGHPIGDQLLKEVAVRLRSCVSEGDTVARFSGDEFAIIQTGVAGREDAEALARSVIESLSQHFVLDGHRVSVGASVGVAMTFGQNTTPENIVREADLALYKGKSEGRGTFCFFEPGMDERLKNRTRLEVDLRNALPAGELSLEFQPIINITTGRTSGMEALLRWNHPEHGAIPPSDFVPVAEEIGVIGVIGDWVLRQACLEASQWPSHISVAVNLSTRQFSENLVDTVASALFEANLAPSRLELEITESLLLQENASTLAILRNLHDLGVRIAMDDFGTGYSALSYLRSFPFDKIKIDRCFIKDLPGDSDSDAIVCAVMDLAVKLGISITAEGIETREQFDHLAAMGCTEAQGFHLSRPMPAKDAGVFLKDGRRRDAA